ncbi:MAG: DUF87 domain-containing protein [archaeon]
MREILIGRDEEDVKKFGFDATGFIGKHYVKTGDEINLSGEVYMDLSRPHVMLICGKRGTGKSYTLGVIAEEINFLPEKLKKQVAVLIFDLMGIFWTMKYPNMKDGAILKNWGLEGKALTDVNLIVPFGHVERFTKAGIPVDTAFALKPSELSAQDLEMVFGLDQNSMPGVLLERALKAIREDKEEFTIEDIVECVRRDDTVDQTVKLAVENKLVAAIEWGLFHEKGTPLKDIIKAGKINILDISPYSSSIGGWSIRALVIGLLTKKIFQARTGSRKTEEVKTLSAAKHPLLERDEGEKEIPMTWIFIDEAHEVLPREGSTPATEPLLQVIREGRQPGLTLVIATQQPGKIHTDVMSQCDIVLAHRVTSLPDIDALNKIMANYMVFTLEKYLSGLPRVKGSAVLLDDNSEKVYAVRTRPRLTWHGGESASLLMGKIEHEDQLETRKRVD